MKKIILPVMLCAACLCLVPYLSERENAENVVERMSYDDYQRINDSLGGTNDIIEIARIYTQSYNN